MRENWLLETLRNHCSSGSARRKDDNGALSCCYGLQIGGCNGEPGVGFKMSLQGKSGRGWSKQGPAWGAVTIRKRRHWGSNILFEGGEGFERSHAS